MVSYATSKPGKPAFAGKDSGESSGADAHPRRRDAFADVWRIAICGGTAMDLRETSASKALSGGTVMRLAVNSFDAVARASFSVASPRNAPPTTTPPWFWPAGSQRNQMVGYKSR